ncbi:MAG: Fur family transcriptional regulator [Minisyncoccota bacterium]
MSHKHEGVTDARGTLRDHGFRVTSGRVKLLDLLRKSGKPLSVQAILSKWKGAPDQATLYRTLTDLANAGVVKRVDLNTGTAHFEYTPDRPHHHHVVCTDCGTIEDIESCGIGDIQKQVSKISSRFKKIESHSLEFFGRCVQCA